MALTTKEKLKEIFDKEPVKRDVSKKLGFGHMTIMNVLEGKIEMNDRLAKEVESLYKLKQRVALSFKYD